MVLTEAGKEELAFALILLKDFKCQGKFDFEITKAIFGLSKLLGVEEQFNNLLSQVPVMKIEVR